MWRSFARLLAHFDRRKLEPTIALRNALGVGLPLAIGTAIGMPLGGLAVASGALQVAYSDGHDPYSRRGFRMLLSTVLCSIAVMVGGLTGRSPLLSATAVALWGFISGFIVLLGAEAESLGLISLVTLIIYAAQSLTIARAFNAGLLAFAGGLLQTTLSVLLWPLSRRDPERRALASLYLELSNSIVISKSKEAPIATAEMNQAQDALRRLGGNRDSESQRLWSLLNQAERLRLSLLTLERLRKRAAREAEQSADVETIGHFLQRSAEVLRAIADTLATHKIRASAHDALRELQELANRYRSLETQAEAAFPAAVRKSVRHQLDAVAGQLRSSFRLATNRILAESAAAPTEAMPSWKDRVRDDLSTLRANLTLQSAGFRHAVRLSATLAIGEIIAHAVSARRSYWLPMTISLVLKPEFTVTFTRGLLRIGGTIAGLLLSTLLFHFLHPVVGMEVFLVMLFVFLVRWIGPANYGIFAINVSALVVLMIAFTGLSPKDAILARGLMTTLGGITALAAYAIWPTWETARSSEVLAQMLESYRRYFRLVAARYLHSEPVSAATLNRARVDARRARSTLEASIGRLRLEPVANADDINALDAILASSHRFINAAMALEGAHHESALPNTEALDSFCRAVNTTLELLILALCGERVPFPDRPDLREAHHALLAMIGKEEFTLLADETDRIANSLNTLSEQVLTWRRPKHAAEGVALATESA